MIKQAVPSQSFDFDEWLNADTKPEKITKETIKQYKATYSKIWCTPKIEITKPRKPAPPAEVFVNYSPPHFRTANVTSDPEVFDVKTWYPSYLVSKEVNKSMPPGTQKEKPISFQENYSFPRSDEFDKLEKTNLEDYCKELIEWETLNCDEGEQDWKLKKEILKSLVVYQNYLKVLLPAFQGNVDLAIYAEVIRKRIFNLVQRLAKKPEEFETCVAELNHIFQQLAEDNEQAHVIIMHYLSDLILSYIELHEEDTSDRFVWLRLATWLHDLSVGSSDEILKAHFMCRCPKTVGLDFHYPGSLTHAELRKIWAYKPKSYLSNLKNELLKPSTPLPDAPIEASVNPTQKVLPVDDTADCFKLDDIVFSDEEDLNSGDNIRFSERSPSLSEISPAFDSTSVSKILSPEDTIYSETSASITTLEPTKTSASLVDETTQFPNSPVLHTSENADADDKEAELESNDDYRIRMGRLFLAFEFLKNVQYLAIS